LLALQACVIRDEKIDACGCRARKLHRIGCLQLPAGPQSGVSSCVAEYQKAFGDAQKSGKELLQRLAK